MKPGSSEAAEEHPAASKEGALEALSGVSPLGPSHRRWLPPKALGESAAPSSFEHVELARKFAFRSPVHESRTPGMQCNTAPRGSAALQAVAIDIYQQAAILPGSHSSIRALNYSGSYLSNESQSEFMLHGNLVLAMAKIPQVVQQSKQYHVTLCGCI